MNPDKLGKYEIRGTLGRGAMGLVHDGWDPLIHRRVAIKTVRLAGADDEEATEGLARFRREAQAAGRLSHPNIVGVYDFGETDDVAYIVMEFVAGGSLKEVLDKRETLDPAWVCKIIAQVLAALAFSHARGVVHRDVKPANVMLGEDCAVKLADFGIARIESSAMTSVGVVMGTPAYMAPEQFLGEPADARSDIYAAGAMAFHLLTGSRPYEGNPSAIMHKVLNATCAPRASERLPGLPGALDPVLQRAMARQPEHRFQDAAAFGSAMNAALRAPEPDGERTIIMRAPTPRIEARSEPSPAPTSPPAQPPRPRPANRAKLLAGAATLLVAAGSAAWLLTHPRPPAPAAAPPIPAAIRTPAAAAPPNPAEVARAVNLAIAQVPCSLAHATLEAGGLTIAGVAGAGGADARLHQEAASAASGLDTRWNLTSLDGPYCTALDAARATSGAVAVQLREDTRHLPANTSLHPIVAGLPFPAFLRVDYLSSDGSLAHMYPHLRDPALKGDQADPSVVLATGAALKLGAAPHTIFQVFPPFGTDMILVVACSEKLLPDARPNTEPPARYLSDLRAALDNAVARGARTASGVLALKTVKN